MKLIYVSVLLFTLYYSELASQSSSYKILINVIDSINIINDKVDSSFENIFNKYISFYDQNEIGLEVGDSLKMKYNLELDYKIRNNLYKIRGEIEYFNNLRIEYEMLASSIGAAKIGGDLNFKVKSDIKMASSKSIETLKNINYTFNLLSAENEPLEEVIPILYGSSGNNPIPPLFPWPPPNASAIINLTDNYTSFASCNNYGDVSSILDRALVSNSYEKVYFSVPGGFAIVTKLEVINEDGSSKDQPDRYDINYISAKRIISLRDYIRSLFFGKSGYYRTIVFVITDKPFALSNDSITELEMKEIIPKGETFLSEAFKKYSFTKNHNVIALIYEFEIKESDKIPVLSIPSRLTGINHLVKSNILAQLK